MKLQAILHAVLIAALAFLSAGIFAAEDREHDQGRQGLPLQQEAEHGDVLGMEG